MYFKNHWLLYAMLILPAVYYIMFQYLPMYGLLIAFKDYNLFLGVWDSKWIGFDVFKEVFRTPNFWSSIVNTLVLNGLNLLIGFPAPIILALMLNEINNGIFKKGIQTVLYLPHFISWVIIGGMMYQIFSTSSGIVNSVVKMFGGNSVPFLTDNGWWIFVYVVVSVWHDIGWGAIIYMATLSSVDPALYEAAKVDGASMFQRILHIDIPELMPMAILQLILSASNLMNVGFEKVFLLQTDLNKAASDIIAVYVYDQGILNAKYSYSTAIGLFNTLVNIALLFIVTRVARKVADYKFV